MKILAAAVVLCSLSVPRLLPPSRPLADAAATQHARKGGRWYLADSGHAVYCYGPVMTITQPTGGLQRVATYCQGNSPMVPLRD